MRLTLLFIIKVLISEVRSNDPASTLAPGWLVSVLHDARGHPFRVGGTR